MSDNFKLIVVGATGCIGKPLLHKSKVENYFAYGTSSAGSENLLSLRLDAPANFDYRLIQAGDVLFLTAAISAPDICAREHERAWDVNVTGTSEFISKVIERGGRVVFFSSDTVYGERDDAFDEQAPCNPAGEYAEMKHAVEKQFLGNPLFKAIRLSYVFSHEDKFTKYLAECVKRGETAELFHPFYRAIVHRGDVIDGAFVLAKRWNDFPQQVVNFGGPEVLSRVDFADRLKRAVLPDLMFRVTQPEDEFFKNRPRMIAMSSNILPELLRRPSRSLAEAAQIEFASNLI